MPSDIAPEDDRLRRLDALLRREGAVTAAQAGVELGVSQPTFSRLVAAARGAVRVVGRARATRYLASREIPRVGVSVPIYQIGLDGGVTTLAQLHGAGTAGYYLESEVARLESAYYVDLPWFLHDQRPAGFLGRLGALRHPELELPANITVWNGDQVLRYLARHGWDVVGDLVVGDDGLRAWHDTLQHPGGGVSEAQRSQAYPRLADDVLSHGDPGSSAAGEQPKFLVTRAEDGQGLLVKFSPPLGESLGRRVAELLLAEHLALTTLAAHGVPAASSRYLELGGRAFLEVERFDRVPPHGRRGVVSLQALDAEYGGGPDLSWRGACADLVRKGALSRAALPRVAVLARFGELIGNTDMHQGNLSFFVDRARRVVDVCPAYDMAAMRYAPRHNQLPRLEPWTPAPPTPADGPVEARAQAAATAFWQTVAADLRASPWLRETAAEHLAGIAQLAPLLAHQPTSRRDRGGRPD